MGAAVSLFFSANDPDKQTLYRRITLSDEQFQGQQDRWNALADYLATDLKDRSGYPIRTWLQGSYKFATQIRPVRCTEEFDIDLGVYFQWEGSPQDGRHDAKTLKCFVQDSLQEYALDNADDVMEVTPPKPCCCRIRYKSSFHIDVPAYHLDAERDARSLATESGREDSDPKAIYIWFRDGFDDVTRAKVRRQIKYTKTWAALKFRENSGRPSSTLLTVLVADAAKAVGTSISGADDDTLREILEKIVERLEADREVSNPVKKSENLARLSHAEMTAFIRHLKIFLDVAKRATEKDTELAAADIWQDAFEHLFPMPEVTEFVTEAARRLPVPLVMPEVKVTAVSRDNPATGRFPDTNRIARFPRTAISASKLGTPTRCPRTARSSGWCAMKGARPRISMTWGTMLAQGSQRRSILPIKARITWIA